MNNEEKKKKMSDDDLDKLKKALKRQTPNDLAKRFSKGKSSTPKKRK